MKLLAGLLCAAAVSLPAQTWAQSEAELKAAADNWLAQDQVNVRFKSARGWFSTFKAYPRRGKMNFVGSTDSVCRGHAVPTSFMYTAPDLVFDFHPRVKGCAGGQYRFNPVTGAGAVFVSPDGGKTWSKQRTPDRVTLVR